ncbi:MAG: hypothetical protein AB7U20_14485, partial [Planctomycetaceae bacterium]
MASKLCLSIVCLHFLLLTGCSKDPTAGTSPSPAANPANAGGGNSGGGGEDYYDSYYGAGEITFVDEVATNVAVGDEITSLTFTDIDGNVTALSDYVGKKSVVLVITRGNTNPICPYCTTQTSRLI